MVMINSRARTRREAVKPTAKRVDHWVVTIHRASRLKTWLLAAATVSLAAVLLRNLGVVSPVLPSLWEKAYNATEFLVVAACALRVFRASGPERVAWGALTLGLLGYAAGDVYYTAALQDLASPPYPSAADAGY